MQSQPQEQGNVLPPCRCGCNSPFLCSHVQFLTPKGVREGMRRSLCTCCILIHSGNQVMCKVGQGRKEPREAKQGTSSRPPFSLQKQQQLTPFFISWVRKFSSHRHLLKKQSRGLLDPDATHVPGNKRACYPGSSSADKGRQGVYIATRSVCVWQWQQGWRWGRLFAPLTADVESLLALGAPAAFGAAVGMAMHRMPLGKCSSVQG